MNWKERMQRAIESAVEEIRTSAFSVISTIAENKPVTSARIVISLSPDFFTAIRYDVTVGLLPPRHEN